MEGYMKQHKSHLNDFEKSYIRVNKDPNIYLDE